MAQKTLRRPAELVEAGLIPSHHIAEIEAVASRYAIAITPDMAGLIDPTDPGDPMALQFVPRAAELIVASEERADPIGDDAFSPLKGIVHRYPDRVLLKPSHICPVYCRFCFRRETVGPGSESLSEAELAAAFDYIRAHSEIWEVILTGGDPLLLSARRIAEIIRALDSIPHVQVIRIHSRVPVVEPALIDANLLAALEAGKAVYVAIHANHPREFDEPQRKACARLARAGIPLLGQTVLLRGVNDDAATLTGLFRAMVANRIKPYYLHHGDLARGTGHFRTDLAQGQALMRALRGRVSGLCQPHYVLDIPGGHGKVPVGPNYLSAGEKAGDWQVEDPTGRTHLYPPKANDQ